MKLQKSDQSVYIALPNFFCVGKVAGIKPNFVQYLHSHPKRGKEHETQLFIARMVGTFCFCRLHSSHLLSSMGQMGERVWIPRGRWRRRKGGSWS